MFSVFGVLETRCAAWSHRTAYQLVEAASESVRSDCVHIDHRYCGWLFLGLNSSLSECLHAWSFPVYVHVFAFIAGVYF